MELEEVGEGFGGKRLLNGSVGGKIESELELLERFDDPSKDNSFSGDHGEFPPKSSNTEEACICI